MLRLMRGLGEQRPRPLPALVAQEVGRRQRAVVDVRPPPRDRGFQVVDRVAQKPHPGLADRLFDLLLHASGQRQPPHHERVAAARQHRQRQLEPAQPRREVLEQRLLGRAARAPPRPAAPA